MKHIFVSYVDMHFIDMFLHLNNCTTKCEIHVNTYYIIMVSSQITGTDICVLIELTGYNIPHLVQLLPQIA